MNIHTLHFKENDKCFTYAQIKLGKKKVDGRKYSLKNAKIKIGDKILFTHDTHGTLECKVTDVKYYSDLSEYVKEEGLNNIFGDVTKCRNINTLNDAVNFYKEYFDKDELLEAKRTFGFGFIGIRFIFIHEYKSHHVSVNELSFNHMTNDNKNKNIHIITKHFDCSIGDKIIFYSDHDQNNVSILNTKINDVIYSNITHLHKTKKGKVIYDFDINNTYDDVILNKQNNENVLVLLVSNLNNQ
jgi:ASC-1-like (ASCH) protein